MTTQTTTNLSDSVRAQYVAIYQDAAYNMRLYDMLAEPVPGISMAEAIRGSSVSLPFIGSMAPATSAISQTADLTPVVLDDDTESITPTSRGNALSWAEAIDIQAYTDYGAARYKKLAENMMESVDLLALEAAFGGTWVERVTTRGSMDAGTPAHRASDSIFRKFQGMLATLKVPGWRDTAGQSAWAAIMHPFSFHDICESGNIDAIGLYQDAGIHLNFEQAKVGPFRLVVSPWAKVLAGAGADNATAVADTLTSAAAALDKTYVTVSNNSANVAAGLFWNIGTEETSTTYYATNEQVKNLSASTYTITFTGMGENGGFRFAHAAGAAVNNNDSIYPIIFGGPGSMKKVHVPGWEFGTIVGPKVDGLLDQFGSLGWKFYGGYGLLTQNAILRFEGTTSYEA